MNSLYPSCMKYRKTTFSENLFFLLGKYVPDNVYDIYVQMLSCSFKIKKNKIPTIQIKNDRFHFKENEYLETSNGEIVVLTLTSVDLKLFFEHYDTYNLEYISGWKFKSIQGIFTEYIDKWTERKIKASKEGNKGQRTLAKLMLNALYGKFATGLTVQNKIPYLEEGIVKYKLRRIRK